MIHQLDLFKKTRFEAWKEFHAENPHVWVRFREMAIELYDAGHRKISARMIWECLRRERMLITTNANYKFNNDLTGYYSRLLSQTDSRFETVFEFRDSRFEGLPSEILSYHMALASM